MAISYSHQEHNYQRKLMEVIDMGSIKEEANQYEPPKTKNITDLEKVSVDLTLQDREGKDNNGEKFTYKVIIVDGEEYRVPGSVIGGLKGILEKKADLKFFSVSKQGEGMNTRYTVIPIE